MKNRAENRKYDKHQQAFSLVECIIAGAVVMIVMVAIMTFRSTAVASAEHAEDQLLAAYSANLLLEAWRGQKADPAFDPLLHGFDTDFQIEKMTAPGLFGMDPSGSQAAGLHSQAGLTILGNYRIHIDNKEFFVQLAYGGLTGVKNLRAIHALVVWQDYRKVRCEYYLPTLSQI